MKYIGPPQGGSLAAVTFARNQWGQYQRARVAPTQSTSSEAIAARAALSAAETQWQALTDTQRIAWGEYARTMMARGNLVAHRGMSGHNAHNRSFLTMTAAGLTPFTDPPEQPVFNVQNVTWSWAVVNSDMTPSTTPPSNTIPLVANHRLLLYASDAVNPGAMATTSFPRPLLLSAQVLGFNLNGIATQWYSRYPAWVTPPYPTGLAVLFRAVEMSNGVLGTPFYSRLIGP